MIQPYFEVFYTWLEGGGELQNIEDPSLLGLGYQMLLLASSKLMGDNKEFDESAIFWGVLLSVWGVMLQNIEDSSLVIFGYQLLLLATSMLIGDNKEFDDSVIFWGILLIVWGEKLQNINDSSLVIPDYNSWP